MSDLHSHQRSLSRRYRRVLFDKFSGLCADCNEPLNKGWDAHHVEGHEWAETQETNLFYMVALCKSCHKLRHKKSNG